MPETPQEYLKRLSNYLGDQDPIKVQRATAQKIAGLIRGIPRKTLMHRPAPGKWSIAEIIAHLADDELVGAYRMRKILERPGTPIEAFDQDKWAETGKYARRDAKKSLELFCTIREANLGLLKHLDSAQWDLYGVHSERGEEGIRTIARHFACHDINHMKQIEAILAKGGGRAKRRA
ncbi:MAG TPA: DinB family protein [Candidatus Acidoferrales bacterium]|nr:DinB family protein [Candidatus Acidoferrales bacterium]